VRIAIALKIETAQGELARSLATAGLIASRSRGTRKDACDLLTRLGEDTSRFAEKSGFISTWHVMGPLGRSSAKDLSHLPFSTGKPILDTGITFKDRLMTWQARPAGHADGVVDLTYLDPNKNGSAFALATLNWPRDEDVLLKVGSDDGVAVWVNRTLVHENFTSRGVTLDEDICKARLKRGPNEILLKISQGGGGWAFCVRVTSTDDKPFDLTSADHGSSNK
jgi:hypothetical protein